MNGTPENGIKVRLRSKDSTDSNKELIAIKILGIKYFLRNAPYK